jgi:hypothetical protein
MMNYYYKHQEIYWMKDQKDFIFWDNIKSLKNLKDKLNILNNK